MTVESIAHPAASCGVLILFALLAATAAGAARLLETSVTVSAPLAEVWNVWTTSAGAASFFAPQANIQLQVGAPYEIFFNPADERLSTKGCKVLSYLPEEMLSFQWSLPGDVFPELPKGGTWVVVTMRAVAPDRTRVTISHLGWGDGAVWDRAYAHMQRGWADLAQRFEQRFTSGPIDWQSQAMLWQERAPK